MTTHTTTADENGNFSITLGTALTSGETIEVTAQKNEQSKSIVIQAPSEPYLPPELPPESGGNTNNEDVVESHDGKFAITTSFPNNSDLSAAAAIAVNDGYGIEKDPLRFNRGAKVRKVGDIYYVKPNIPATEANTDSIKMHFAIRVKRSDVYAAVAEEKIITVAELGYYDDGGIGYQTEDEQFDIGNFLVNYSKTQFFMGVNANKNAVADIDYMYIVVPLYFSVSGGTFAHSKHGIGDNIYILKDRRKASIFGTVFKIQLDAE
jgi:hypothetical protein